MSERMDSPIGAAFMQFVAMYRNAGTKDAVVATMRSSGTWNGEPRPGRYRIVPAPMDGEPGALAYVRGPDGRYHAVCLTVLSLDADGSVVELTTVVLPELFAAWGFPPVFDA
jgi:RNA polymerase sigma-70 factor, ECF subfamily